MHFDPGLTQEISVDLQVVAHQFDHLFVIYEISNKWYWKYTE